LTQSHDTSLFSHAVCGKAGEVRWDKGFRTFVKESGARELSVHIVSGLQKKGGYFMSTLITNTHKYKKFINRKQNQDTQSLTEVERDESIFNSLFGNKNEIDYRLVRVHDGMVFGYTIINGEKLTIFKEDAECDMHQVERWKKIKEIFTFFGCSYSDYFEVPDIERCKEAYGLARQSIAYENKYQKSIVQSGELGECIAGHCLNLHVSKSLVQAGYDAIDKDFNRVQIKTKRLHPDGEATSETLSILKEEGYDYCLLVLLNNNYTLNNIYRMEKSELDSILKIRKTKRIKISDFTKYPLSTLKSRRQERKAIEKTSYYAGKDQPWLPI